MAEPATRVTGATTPAQPGARPASRQPAHQASAASESSPGFEVRLDVFEGPFDLLLALISKHKLDITEVALSKVTDDFIAYIHTHGEGFDLDQASHFLVVAATLLDLKAARLLPAGEVEDEADLALLEARDLLFARLLQYRAYKEVAAILRERLAREERRWPRRVPIEPRFAELLPEVLLGLGPVDFARLAARAMTPKPPPRVPLDHLHAPQASVAEQQAVVARLLGELGEATFRQLTADCEGVHEIVARFLALLELYRDEMVAFTQDRPLGELHVTWIGRRPEENGARGGPDRDEAAEGQASHADPQDGTSADPTP